MPTYSLLEARNLANELIDAVIPAEIIQVSNNRFHVDADYLPDVPKVREKFSFNRGWLAQNKAKFPKMLGFVMVFIAVAALLITVASAVIENPKSTAMAPSASGTSSQWESQTSSSALEDLLASGQANENDNQFREVKRIELGGYLTLFINQSLRDQTKLIRADLVKKAAGWQIEKWTQLE